MIRVIKSLFFSLIYCCTVFPVYYKAAIATRFNEQMNDKQFLLLLKDAHNASKELNSLHINCMKKLMARLKVLPYKNSIMVIAEDVASYRGFNTAVKNYNKKRSVYIIPESDYDNSFGVNPLLSLVNFTLSQGLQACNIEHRFLRFCSLIDDSILYNGVDGKNNSITTKAIALEIDQVLKKCDRDSHNRRNKIAQLKCGSRQERHDLLIVEEWWQSYKKRIDNTIQLVSDELKDHDGTLASYVINSSEELFDKNQLLNALLYHDSDIVTLNALNALANAHNKKKIIVVAGGSHITDLEEIIKKMGFTTIKEIGEDYDWDTVAINDFLNATSLESLKKVLGNNFELISNNVFDYFASLT